MNDKNYINKNSGFTLIELIVTFAIISILSMVALISVNSYVKQAYIVADQSTARTLNSVTAYFRVTNDSGDPFNVKTNSSHYLMDVLISNNVLEDFIEPQTENTMFKWDFNNQAWYFVDIETFYTLSKDDGLIVINNGGQQGFLKGPYNGVDKDVLLPKMLDGVLILEIYQDVFKNNNLTSFVFDNTSVVTRIHARAFLGNSLSTITFPNTLNRIDQLTFKNNKLTEITLPESITIIEQKAFEGNNITKITIGNKLTSIGTNAFGNNHTGFVDAYTIGGAGTYNFINGVWVKQ